MENRLTDRLAKLIDVEVQAQSLGDVVTWDLGNIVVADGGVAPDGTPSIGPGIIFTFAISSSVIGNKLVVTQSIPFNLAMSIDHETVASIVQGALETLRQARSNETTSQNGKGLIQG